MTFDPQLVLNKHIFLAISAKPSYPAKRGIRVIASLSQKRETHRCNVNTQQDLFFPDVLIFSLINQT